MFDKKAIYEMLAALGTGTALLTGCGSSDKPVNAPEVPAAASEPAQSTQSPEANAPKAAAEPAKEQAPAPASAAAPSDAGAPAKADATAPAASSSAKQPKAPAKKPTKKGAHASCGEGTCG